MRLVAAALALGIVTGGNAALASAAKASAPANPLDDALARMASGRASLDDFQLDASWQLEQGNRRDAMGWVAATTLGRVWMIALAVLLVGLLDEREAGLAAAVLSAILFTVHFAGRFLARAMTPPEERI